MQQLFIISHDLKRPGQGYRTLISALKQMSAKRVLKSQWAAMGVCSRAEELRDTLMAFIDDNDRLLVTEVRDWASYNLIAPLPTRLFLIPPLNGIAIGFGKIIVHFMDVHWLTNHDLSDQVHKVK